MLVLTRKETEEIVIKLESGETITISIERISGERVKIGIDAPKHIPVIRRELLNIPTA
jgi:carbon storage regulator